MTPFSEEMLRLSGVFQSGVMPFAGGYYEQPRAILEGLRVLEANLLHARLTKRAKQGQRRS